MYVIDKYKGAEKSHEISRAFFWDGGNVGMLRKWLREFHLTLREDFTDAAGNTIFYIDLKHKAHSIIINTGSPCVIFWHSVTDGNSLTALPVGVLSKQSALIKTPNKFVSKLNDVKDSSNNDREDTFMDSHIFDDSHQDALFNVNQWLKHYNLKVEKSEHNGWKLCENTRVVQIFAKGEPYILVVLRDFYPDNAARGVHFLSPLPRQTEIGIYNAFQYSEKFDVALPGEITARVVDSKGRIFYAIQWNEKNIEPVKTFFQNYGMYELSSCVVRPYFLEYLRSGLPPLEVHPMEWIVYDFKEFTVYTEEGFNKSFKIL